MNHTYLKALYRPVAGKIEASSRRVMFRFDAPIDWHVGEIWDVKKGRIPGVRNHICEHGYVQLRFLSDGKEQYAELLQAEYGLQRNWLVLKPMVSEIGTDRAAPAGVGGMKVSALRAELK